MLYSLDLFGTLIFAATGALMGIHKKLDMFGVIVVGFVTAVGGGTIRDLILGNTPVFWLKDLNYLFAVLIGSTITFMLGKNILRLNIFLSISDAIGLGVFTLIGISKGLNSSLPPVFCVVMGVITAVAGGVIRDSLCQEIPMVLSREIYATACIAGGVLFFALRAFEMPETWSAVICVIVIIAIRLISIRMNLSLPKREDS
ncbi:MAG: trimeric intracellular cation channel family protein [Spirochaetota bacterium]